MFLLKPIFFFVCFFSTKVYSDSLYLFVFFRTCLFFLAICFIKITHCFTDLHPTKSSWHRFRAVCPMLCVFSLCVCVSRFLGFNCWSLIWNAALPGFGSLQSLFLTYKSQYLSQMIIDHSSNTPSSHYFSPFILNSILPTILSF